MSTTDLIKTYLNQSQSALTPSTSGRVLEDDMQYQNMLLLPLKTFKRLLSSYNIPSNNDEESGANKMNYYDS